MNQRTDETKQTVPPRSSRTMPPSLACLLHYVVVGPASVMMHDALGLNPRGLIISNGSSNDNESSLLQRSIALLFGVYALALLLIRLYMISSKVALLAAKSNGNDGSKTTAIHRGHATTEIANDPSAVVWYEHTWLCNVALLMTAWALWTNRPALAWAHGVTVAIDQVLWYVDGMVYLLTSGKTVLVGVFSHILLQPNIQWYHHLTCWHHIWNLPLLAVATTMATRTTDNDPTTDEQSFWIRFCAYYYPTWLLASGIMTLNVVASRILTPHGVVVQTVATCPTTTTRTTTRQPGRRQFFYYLNINLSHEVWKDLAISIGFLRIQQDHPAVAVYLWRLLTRWMLLNSILWAAAVAGALAFGSAT